MGHLCDAFAASRQGAASDDLEAELADRCQKARDAWPGLVIDDGDFCRYLGERAQPGLPAEASLRRLCVDDLYLACGCALGLPAALRAFDERLLWRVKAHLSRLNGAADLVDETRQALRARLLAASADAPPRIIQYNGQAPLDSWLRVAAIRVALNLLESERSRRQTRLLDEQLVRDGDGDVANLELDYLREQYRGAFVTALRQAIAELPSSDRALLRFSFVDELTPEHIGGIYGVHRTTILRRITAAKNRILERTRALVMGELQISPSECDSLLTLLRSRLPLTLRFGVSIASGMTCLDENQVIELIGGQMSAAEREAIDAHLDECAACRALLAGAAQPGANDRSDSDDDSAITAGSLVSRYVILRVVGIGGMGVVYAAHDPGLDRKVAVKLLRKLDAAGADALRVRLLREAQAMARLTHPNVVAVYDVGAVDGQVFIVMEYIEGTTLTRWLSERPRSLREVLTVFCGVGDGLAAAHAVGLVHRDVKPDNVLIANDGRVLVTDFGLARSAPLQLPSPSDLAIEDGGLTETGALLGTPAYMSPEQLAGDEVTARSDAFSFCTALYEALYGERPYAGDSVATLRAAIAGGRVREPARNARVPAWLRQVLLRGLSPAPAARHADMAQLVGELSRHPAATRRRIATAIGVAVLVGAVFLGQQLQAKRALTPPCRGGAQKLAQSWNDQKRHAVSSALQASGKPFAATTSALLEQTLDAYANGWLAMYTDACEATRIRAEQSEDVMQLRMTCLSSRLDELGALADILMKPESADVDIAVQAGRSLSPLAQCADVRSLVEPMKPPRDAATLAKVDELRRQLARIKASHDAGRYAEAKPLAAGLRDEAVQLGYAPLEGRARFELASIELSLGELKPAEAELVDAACASIVGHDDEQAAQAWVSLVSLVGYDEARTVDARRWARIADAAVRRLGGRRRDLEASLLDSLSGISGREGEWTRALAEARQVVALRGQIFPPDSLEIGKALVNLGVALQDNHDEQSALEVYQRAQAIYTHTFGPDHPRLATTHFSVGTALNNVGRLREAEDEYRQALTIAEATLGPKHLDVAWYLSGLAMLLIHTGRAEAALAPAQRALAIREAALDAMHVDIGHSHDLVGDIHQRLGRFAEALAHGQRAAAIYDHVYPRAAGYAGYITVGEAQLALGQRKRALATLENAYQVGSRTNVSAIESAHLKLALAKALVANGKDSERARALALEAQAAWTAAPALNGSELADVARWLATRKP